MKAYITILILLVMNNQQYLIVQDVLYLFNKTNIKTNSLFNFLSSKYLPAGVYFECRKNILL